MAHLYVVSRNWYFREKMINWNTNLWQKKKKMCPHSTFARHDIERKDLSLLLFGLGRYGFMLASSKSYKDVQITRASKGECQGWNLRMYSVSKSQKLFLQLPSPLLWQKIGSTWYHIFISEPQSPPEMEHFPLPKVAASHLNLGDLQARFSTLLCLPACMPVHPS